VNEASGTLIGKLSKRSG